MCNSNFVRDETPIAVHWFRRDLRLDDNTALYHALSGDLPVLPVFIFDTDILDDLKKPHDRRIDFIYKQLENIQQRLLPFGASLWVGYGKPIDVWQQLCQQYNIQKVYANRDYEPYARQRDQIIYTYLASRQIAFKGFKDHVIFEKNEVLKSDGTPYTVFTPYSRAWHKKYEELTLFPAPITPIDRFYRIAPQPFPSLADMGFAPTYCAFPVEDVSDSLIADYQSQRDYPAIAGTSRLSVHLRFGTISLRELMRIKAPLSLTWQNELVWRDFFQMILFHFPHVVTHAFKPAYDRILWQNDISSFEQWCEGKTGYPLVDAGMRELVTTGFMHNRVRMVTASFLVKHLWIDWRWGEAFFAQHLLDFDLAANNGGWQWAAGSGCDAAPYFRIFNPIAQQQKFDKNFEYVKRWIPEWGTLNYPKPIIEHEFARERTLSNYKKYLIK